MVNWEQRYQTHDMPWEKGYAAPPLEDYLKNQVIEGSVLVPGCGLGHDARLLARHGAKVTGLDIAPTAIKQAKEFPGPVVYVLGDFFYSPEFLEKFDWIVEHTCFCAIDPKLRLAYVQSAYQKLNDKGKFFGIFYLNPEVEEGPPYGITTSELNFLFDPYFILEKEWVPQQSYEGREARELVRIYKKRIQ